jgi:radical SAM-linked protein
VKNVRIWFRKIGSARYISHLDLNRCMSRAMHKAKIPLWYTQGFNPHAFLTFALPLPLGVKSGRESMDVKLDGDLFWEDNLSREELIARLNSALPADLAVFDVTEPVMKPGQIASASYLFLLDTERADAQEVCDKIRTLFDSSEILVPKHTKSGMIDFDLKPYLGQTQVTVQEGGVKMESSLPAGSTMNVNPLLLTEAIKKYLGLDLYADIERTHLYDGNGKIFE